MMTTTTTSTSMANVSKDVHLIPTVNMAFVNVMLDSPSSQVAVTDQNRKLYQDHKISWTIRL